jgi:hypothetical protein
MKSERELWSAVLGQAIEDLRDTKTGYRTRLWFASDNYGPGSFLWICDSLELDALSVRRAALLQRQPGALLLSETSEPTSLGQSR